MGRDRSTFHTQLRRSLLVSVRTCYGSICKHPFLLGCAAFLIFLNRTFPFLFSLLIWASPVLICTAILLGTILSLGQSNLPEIDHEPAVNHGSGSLKPEVAQRSSKVLGEDESYMVERYMRKKGDGMKAEHEESRTVEPQLTAIGKNSVSVDYKSAVEEGYDENLREKQTTQEMERQFHLKVAKNRGGDYLSKEATLNAGSRGNANANNDIQSAGYESLDEMIRNSKDDQLDLSPVSPWNPLRHDYDDDDDDGRGESLDSGSDGAESSSPDASMADIIPMLDELHPLLDVKISEPAHLTQTGSDGASEGTNHTTDDEFDSDVDTLNQRERHEEDGDGGDNEDDDDEEDDVKDEGKNDESKSAIKWTEADQKNLMDLGTSELERNLRLESLIARRRARKNLTFMTERNLIDLDNVDIPFNVPPITIARRNPFDFPYDTYHDSSLPPIPGSAPSILLVRRNPFDLPYEPNEEKPDLKGDSFQEEFSAFQQKESVFRRHESFNVGPSIFGGARLDRQEAKLRPFFVPERLAGEGPSYMSYERQLSGVSDSKVSSVPDTESVSTGIDEEDKMVSGHVENDTMANVEHASLICENGSQSSDHAEYLDYENVKVRDVQHDVVEITLGGAERHIDRQSSQSDIEEILVDEETKNSKVLGDIGPSVEEGIDEGFKLSSLSDVDDALSEVKQQDSTELTEQCNLFKESGIIEKNSAGGEGTYFAIEDENTNKSVVKEASLPSQPSLEEGDGHFMNIVEGDHQHKEPLYDSSPKSDKQVFPFSSMSSDSRAETSEKSFHFMAETGEKSSKSLPETKENDEHGFEVEEAFNASTGASSLPSNKDGKDVPLGTIATASDGNESGSSKPVEVHSPVIAVDFVSSSINDVQSSISSRMHNEEDEQLSPRLGADTQVDIHYILPSADNKTLEEHYVNEIQISDVEHGQLHSYTRIDKHLDQPTDLKVVSEIVSENNVPSNQAPLSGLFWSDKPMVEPITSQTSDHQESHSQAVEPIGVNFAAETTLHEFYDSEERSSRNLSCLTHDQTASSLDSPEYKTPMVGDDLRPEFFDEEEEDVYKELDSTSEPSDVIAEDQSCQMSYHFTNDDMNEMKHIDENFLSELDKVGDFSLKETVGDSKHEGHTNRRFMECCLPIDNLPVREGKEELDMLEVRTFEDIDFAFKQMHEGVQVHEVILPSMIEEQIATVRNTGEGNVKFELELVEAKSIQDIDFALGRDMEAKKDESAQQNVSESVPPKWEERSGSRSFDVASSTSDSPREKEAIWITGEENVKSDLGSIESKSIGEINIALSRDLEVKKDGSASACTSVPSKVKLEERTGSSDKPKEQEAVRITGEGSVKSDLEFFESNSMRGIDIAVSRDLEVKENGSAKLNVNKSVPSETESEERTGSKSLDVACSTSSDSRREQEATSTIKKAVTLPVHETSPADGFASGSKNPEEEEIDEAILPSIIEGKLTTEGSVDQQNMKYEMGTIDAKSVEDINTAFNKILEGGQSVMEEATSPVKTGLEETVDSSSLNGASSASSEYCEEREAISLAKEEVLSFEENIVDGKTGQPTLEDIDSAFKQTCEEAQMKKFIVPSVVKEQIEVERTLNYSKSDGERIEPKSVEDIDNAILKGQEDYKVGFVKQGMRVPLEVDSGEPGKSVSPGDIDSNSCERIESSVREETVKQHIVEERSKEHVDSLLREIRKGVEIEEVIPSGIHKEQLIGGKFERDAKSAPDSIEVNAAGDAITASKMPHEQETKPFDGMHNSQNNLSTQVLDQGATEIMSSPTTSERTSADMVALPSGRNFDAPEGEIMISSTSGKKDKEESESSSSSTSDSD